MTSFDEEDDDEHWIPEHDKHPKWVMAGLAALAPGSRRETIMSKWLELCDMIPYRGLIPLLHRITQYNLLPRHLAFGLLRRTFLYLERAQRDDGVFAAGLMYATLLELDHATKTGGLSRGGTAARMPPILELLEYLTREQS